MHLAKEKVWSLLQNKLRLKFPQLAWEVETNPNLQPEIGIAQAQH